MVQEERQECIHLLNMRLQICSFGSMYLAYFLWLTVVQIPTGGGGYSQLKGSLVTGHQSILW